ncbi:MAG: ABC transporter permease [Oxalicibacterium faecigallinarum]|uniref:ABC transporter permease n=1 Tax=Oxalicibacterium faecigallinarum TaxID=573741 RepID=UPI002807DF86|nr:ABC transporter permease [Oxalicibacterium faecigallinarum]MDQ7970196.1 ABC transporter permease [Oxalicibacterium faecigallinarum]
MKTAPSPFSPGMTRVARALIGPAALILIWWLANDSAWVSNKLLPNPFATFGTLWESLLSGSMTVDLGATLYRTMYAFAMAAVFGIPVGIALGSNERIYRSVEFLVDFFRSTPATAMFPLFLLIFGIGDFAKIAVAGFSAWLVVVFNVAYGVMNSRKTRILAARVMGASHWRVFRDVLFWESLPQTFVGLRMAVSLALVVIIVAEMFIGSTNGMGHRIIDAQQVFDLQQMYASILMTGGVGYGFNVLFIALEKWIVHWAGR